MINEGILKNEERAVYTLRALYSRYGYAPFKMSKFEEYDLYVRNKDFLISDGIITFTDAAGKLLALKPDVTLSIVKNFTAEKGRVDKLYYNENVYRTASATRNFKEIMQTGLECVGDIGLYDMCEVVTLAVKSLALMAEDSILDVSHAALVSSLLDGIAASPETKRDILDAVIRKSDDAVDSLYESGAISEKSAALIHALTADYTDFSRAKEALSPFALSDESREALDELSAILAALEAQGLSKYININFSLIGSNSYYSGIVFKGYVKGIPDSVLSGGRYDGLMKRMGKNAGAVGFAVYLDHFERYGHTAREYDVDILLCKDADAPAASVIAAVESLSADGETVLVQSAPSDGIRYRKLMRISAEGEVSEYGNA